MPAKKWLLVLNNHSGVGPTRMMSYCNALDPGNSSRHFDYAASPRMDPSVLSRFRGMRNISKVAVTATVDALSAAQVDSGQALATVSRSMNAQRVKIELSANRMRGRGGVLEQGAIRTLIRGLQRQDDEVSRLEVKGNVDGHDQMINLIEHRVKRKYPAADLQVVNHRYTQESRWNLLIRAYRYWHDNL